MSKDTPLFKLSGLRFKDFLSYPDIEIKAGKATFICGESGSGKSTLLKLLNGVLTPAAGSIFYNGKDLAEYDSIGLRREVLLVGQAVYLFDKDIKANFNEFYAFRGQEGISEAEMQRYLALCCFDLPLSSDCSVLSGGERARVFLAINLSLGARVLMLDEPTAALDDATAEQLLKNVSGYCAGAGMSLIVVSHDKTLADRYSDWKILLN